MPAQLPGFSDVVVTDPTTMAANLIGNAKAMFCDVSLGLGAYAVGGAILGSPAAALPQLRTVGALALIAGTQCGGSPTNQGIFGEPPPYTGGQCPVNYVITVNTVAYLSPGGNPQPFSPRIPISAGPLSIENNWADGPLNQVNDASRLKIFDGSGGEILNSRAPFGVQSGSTIIQVARQDGRPDTCGDQAPTGGTVITNVTNGDTINNSNVVDNSQKTYIAPVTFALANFNGTLNIPIGPIKIGSLFPIQFDLNFGGIRIGFEQNPDGTLKRRPVNPDPDNPADSYEGQIELLKKLEQIRQCVCSPPVDIQALFLPTVAGFPNCQDEVQQLMVASGSISPDTVQKFVETAALAKNYCDSQNPPQLPETAIYSASTTQDGRELFTGEIPPEVVSLRLVITEIREGAPDKISLYPASNQRKFGSVSFVLASISGGGDYIYVFDTDTYLPLPKRAKTGRLRILMKSGLSFTVFDTGERL